ncbi:MAG: transcription antitermination factor NusB [Burkholderiales bacterium]
MPGTAEKAAPAAKPAKTKPTSARRRSREFALQGLYQWLLTGTSPEQVMAQLEASDGWERCDRAYCAILVHGAAEDAGRIVQLLGPYLDRKFDLVSPIERAILLIAGYELTAQPDVPYKVALNEAIELAKRYGGTDGDKFINGVLDKLAKSLPAGAAAARSPARA